MPFELKLDRFPEKVWIGGLFVLLILIALWLTSDWFSYFRTATSASTSTERTQLDLDSAMTAISASHLFGRPRAAAVAAPAPAPEAPPLNVKLKGVFAATGVKPAYAILDVDGSGDQPIKLGDELQDGVVLAEVHPAYVTVKRGDATQQIRLEENVASTSPRVAQPRSPAARPSARKEGVAGPTARNGAAPKIESTPKIESAPEVVNPAAGLKIESAPQDSIAQKLGLKKGDVVTQINGQVVTSLDDLARLHQQFSQVGQVVLEGTRDGKPMKLSLN